MADRLTEDELYEMTRGFLTEGLRSTLKEAPYDPGRQGWSKINPGPRRPADEEVTDWIDVNMLDPETDEQFRDAIDVLQKLMGGIEYRPEYAERVKGLVDELKSIATDFSDNMFRSEDTGEYDMWDEETGEYDMWDEETQVDGHR